MSTPHHPMNPRRRQRGTTLVEALIAFLVLSLGMLATARMQSSLRLHADTARQRTEAVRLAQEDIEGLRAFATIQSSASGRAYDDITSATVSLPSDGNSSNSGSSGVISNTRYDLARSVSDAAQAGNAAYKTTSATVSWVDRSGQTQTVNLTSAIAGSNPALSGAWLAAANRPAAAGQLGRSALIPVTAKDLGNGTSAFKPTANGTLAFLLHNDTGTVAAVCTSVAAHLSTSDLTASHFENCDKAKAMLLSGKVRFSLGALPNPDQANQANDMPLDLAFTVALSGNPSAQAPVCSAEAVKVVSYSTAKGTWRAEVPLAAVPSYLGATTWTDLGERYVAYHCAVTPQAPAKVWSGRGTVLPLGWALGALSTQYQLCRYATDLDHSGSIDRNAEHPDTYIDVNGSLTHQNYLVVRGDQACPAGTYGVAG